MYKDLSLKEKAKILQYGGKLGLTSVEDIAKLYDDAVSHKFAEGSMATPDWDPDNPYHYHTANGEKVVITPEDWEKHKGQSYFKQVEDAVLAEQAAHPGPEYIINPKFSEDLRRIYKGNVGPKYQNYSSFSGNLPQGYGFTPEGLVQDNQGNLYVQKGFRQTPRFTYDESNPLTFPVLEGRNKGNVTFYPINMDKEVKPSLPVNSTMNVNKERDKAITEYIKDNTTRSTVNGTMYKEPYFYPDPDAVDYDWKEWKKEHPIQELRRAVTKDYLYDLIKQKALNNFIFADEEGLEYDPFYFGEDDQKYFDQQFNNYINKPINQIKTTDNITKKPTYAKAKQKAVIKVEKNQTEENLSEYKQKGLLTGDDEEVYRNSIKYYEDWINQDNPWLWGDEDRSPKPKKVSRKEAEKKAVIEVGPLQIAGVQTYAKGGHLHQYGEPIKQRQDFKPNLFSYIFAPRRMFNNHAGHGDLERYYFGMPLQDDVLEYSKYKPTNSKNHKANYIAINDNGFKKDLVDAFYSNSPEVWSDKKKNIMYGYGIPSSFQGAVEQQNRLKQGQQHIVPYDLGRFTVTEGFDPYKGQYISYYDIWDSSGNRSHPDLNRPEWYHMWTTKPFEVYDRIYLDDYYGVNSIPQKGTYYGGWLAPVTITPNKYKKGGPIVSPYGQWKYPGRDTIIPSNDITMNNVDYPVLGISDAGDAKVMMPWNDYKFRGSMVYEHPLVGHSAQDGKKFNKKWKALDNIQYNVYPDTSFTREKTGVGDIEVFDKENGDTITYPNGYRYINPYPGQNTIVYNPNTNDEQDIRLDALHLMPQDVTYDVLNTLYRNNALGSDVYYTANKRYEEDKRRYGKNNIDSFNQYYNNEADGLLRNMFIEGSPEYIESKRYYPNKQQLREWNIDLLPYINEIQEYLETGERPKHILPEVVITPNEYKKGGHLFQGNLSSYMNNSQLENARGIWDYLVGQKGLTQRNAAAMMGNVMQESGLNPNAKNPKSSAKGYFQMLDSKRKDYDKWIRNNPHSKDYGEFDYYIHLIDDVVDPYMDGYNSFMKRWDGVKKAYEAKPSDRNRQSMQEYQDYYDRMYRQRVENNRLFPVIDFNRAWNNYELPLNEITPLFEETFERAGEGSEHGKRNNYAQDFYDYFYDPDIDRQEIFNWENNRHMQKRISPVPADFRLPNRPLAQSAQLPTNIYLNEMMLDMPSYNQLMYHEKPQGYFFSNGGIHIKPENRGKFTRLKKRTGHSASWFKAHGTPAQRKMATFALNSKHWNHKHDEGGYLYSEGKFLLAPYLYNE